MPVRLRSSVVLACVLVAIYVVFWRDERLFQAAERPLNVFSNDFSSPASPQDTSGNKEAFEWPPEPEEPDPTAIRMPIGVPHPSKTAEELLPAFTIQTVPTTSSDSSRETESTRPYTSITWAQSHSAAPAASQTQSIKLPAATQASQTNDSLLQKQYEEEYDGLEQKESYGEIYGQTLRKLVDTGVHEGSAASQLSAAASGDWSEFSTTPPFRYNPYPDYNSTAWRASNQGEYTICEGPNGPIEDLVVWSGHPLPFSKPAFGSWITFDLDSNLCFEREYRLSPYSSASKGEGTSSLKSSFQKRLSLNWGQVQQFCVKANEDRFASHIPQQETILPRPAGVSNSTSRSNGTTNGRGMEQIDDTQVPASTNTSAPAVLVKSAVASNTTITNSAKGDGTSPRTAQLGKLPVKRTAILIRAVAGQNYTENDKQNVRSLIAELCFRSGGEYQVYLLVQVSDDLPIWKELAVYQKTLKESVPEEFQSTTVLWSDAQMKELYPLVPAYLNASHSRWFAVQKFQIDHGEFDFFWNWEFDTRYTGQHYNLLEKLNMWAKMQPRKGIWERNERFYIPSEHETYKDFREQVERAVGSDTIWGPVKVPGVTPVGPLPPTDNPKDDDYKWGVGDEADYITLSPIFNPANTTWPSRNDFWGQVKESTPRRASVSTHSRVSRKLLERMHIENLKGNLVGSEMMPATISLLHGFKAVFAPIPVYFDRAWSGASLQKYLNPGPKGVSGSTADSPFGAWRETRFQGATWGDAGNVPMRLYSNWLGREDTGVGGVEWEKTHGRTCLPPMLLRPIKDEEVIAPGHS